MAAPHANWQEVLKRYAYGAGITPGKHSDIMKSKELKRVCAVCAKKLTITLNKEGTIASGGWFFTSEESLGQYDEGAKIGHIGWEYWECNECYEDEDGK
jgi:hypothetical protein